MSILYKTIDYLKMSRIELKKVVWPDKKTTIDHTIMVIGVSLGMAAFLGGLDFLFTYLFNILVK